MQQSENGDYLLKRVSVTCCCKLSASLILLLATVAHETKQGFQSSWHSLFSYNMCSAIIPLDSVQLYGFQSCRKHTVQSTC